MRMMNRWLVLALHALACTSLLAAPFVPASDDEVLETLPESRDATVAMLKRQQSALRARPGDLALASTFARRAIAVSRASGDPRYLGQARAALAPWWSAGDAPPVALLLRATVKQSLHDFPGALADLDRLLAIAPGDAQARLTRATVRNVLGRHADALADCDGLPGGTPALVVTACRADAASRAGRARTAYDALSRALESSRADASLRAWGSTIAAEIAARLDAGDAAERQFRTSLALDAGDPYTLGAYADYLLDRGREREAAALVARHTRNDALLLRYVVALRNVDMAAFERQRGELAARVEASRRRGDGVHLREEARYALDIERDAKAALALARANWDVQREPADLRILAEAARAAGDGAAMRIVADWTRATGLEDARVAALLKGGA
jgi:tetratricopeptide (TPR) repeat protein